MTHGTGTRMMRMRRRAPALLLLLGVVVSAHGSAGSAASDPDYTVAFASFAPLNSDIFVADADGSHPRALLAHPDFDANASFSADGRWIVFTSGRAGSADIYRVRPDGSGLARLTDDPAFDDQGALSPDGRLLAFVSSRSRQADIWILELATKTLRNVTSHPAGDFRPSWSPNGRWLAFSSDRDSLKPKARAGFDTLHSTEIYVVHPDGSGLRRLTEAQAFAGSPVWSSDGRRLVFYESTLGELSNLVSPRRLRASTQIATLDLETGERHVVTSGAGEKWSPRWLAGDRIGYVSGGPDGGVEVIDGPAGARGEFGSPSWSADGRRMVFHRDVSRDWPPLREWHSQDPQFRAVRAGVFPSYAPSGDRLVANDRTAGILHNAILVMDADGRRRATLFQDAERSALGPAWAPQGDRIAFALGRFFQMAQGPAAADIAVMRSDGTGLRTVTDGAGNYGFPSWSPDGRQLVYRSSTNNASRLSIVNVETREVKALTDGSSHDNFPSWSPAGGTIAFTSDREGDYEIYTIKPDGTDLRRLTRTPGNDAHCAWSPDGRWIAFTSARGGFKDEAALHLYNPQPYGDVYVMRADGSDVRMVTDNQFEEGTPTFIPNGRKGR